MTGPDRVRKSTTLASIIARINETLALHILTIEDPVEYVHEHNLSAVSQRGDRTGQPIIRAGTALRPA